jgi:hypothetical protein
VTKDLLSETGIGAGAFGYYRAGEKRFRFAALLRSDAEQAKDVLVTLAKVPGAAKEKSAGEGGVRFMHKGEGAPTEWVFARAGKLVLGIGDEARVLRSGMSAEEHAKVTLARDEKIERLKKALAEQRSRASREALHATRPREARARGAARPARRGARPDRARGRYCVRLMTW